MSRRDRRRRAREKDRRKRRFLEIMEQKIVEQMLLSTTTLTLSADISADTPAGVNTIWGLLTAGEHVAAGTFVVWNKESQTLRPAKSREK